MVQPVSFGLHLTPLSCRMKASDGAGVMCTPGRGGSRIFVKGGGGGGGGGG